MPYGSIEYQSENGFQISISNLVECAAIIYFAYNIFAFDLNETW